jgi:superfamily II DNA or RNA helicase
VQDFVQFEIHNTWTIVLAADEWILQIMDIESRYATELVQARERGFMNPDGDKWDGYIRMLRRPKTRPAYFPTGLFPRMDRTCERMGYTVFADDKRNRPVEGFPEHPEISLRDYQLAAVEAGVRAGRGVFDMPPRSGKTRTMCELHRRIALPTLWVAPTDRIVQQTANVIEGFFGKHYVAHLVGSKNQSMVANKNVVVCTAATVQLLNDEFLKTREMLVVDEWHHGAARTYRKLFKACDHIFFRYGMTGTFFRSGPDELEMHGLLSNTIYKIGSDELVRRGYLVPTRVMFVPVPARPKLRGVGDGFQTGFGKYGIQEHRARNQLVTYAATQLYKLGRKVLVLVGTKRQGRELRRMIEMFLPADSRAEFRAVEFVSTDTTRGIQNRILESFLQNQEVKILIGTSLLGEGVDLPEVDALVYAKGEKAEVTLTQNAYRVCTAVSGKRDAVIVDFADRHHSKLLRHSLERLEVYYREPTFYIDVVDDLQNLGAWLDSAKKDVQVSAV